MKQATSREKVLKNIRKALIHQTPQPFPQLDIQSSVYPRPDESLDIIFAREFTKVQGQFVFCESTGDFTENLRLLTEQQKWQNLYCWDKAIQQIFVQHNFGFSRTGKELEEADAGVTGCEALIARTGSVLLSSKLASGRALPIYPPVHIVVAYSSQLVFDIEDGLKKIREKYGNELPSMINLATGPSRTADIEKTLVLGAHGPKEVYVFLIDEAGN